MSRYTYLAADLRTNAILAELPLRGVNCAQVLDGAGDLNATLPLGDERIRKIDPFAATTPERTALYVVRDNVIVWGGIIWTRRYNHDATALELGANEFWSYYHRRMVRGLEGMTYPGGGSTVFAPTSDVVDDGVVGWPEGTNIADNLDEETVDTFDFLTNSEQLGTYTARFNVGAGDLDGVTPRSVRLAIACGSIVGTTQITPRLTIAGTDYGSAPRQIIRPVKGAVASGTWQTVTFTWDKNPNTLAPWTEADLEAFSSASAGGFGFVAGAHMWAFKVFQMALIVAWDPEVGGRLQFTQVDQFDIVRDLMRHAHHFNGGDIGVQLDDTIASGVVRDRAYYGFEKRPIAETVEDLSNVIDGFDFAIDVRYDQDVPAKFLTLSHPRRGRDASSPFLPVFDLPGNILDYEWPEDGTRSANTIHSLGAGEGDDILAVTAVDLERIEAGWPVLEDVTQYKDVSELPTLEAHADADLAAFSRVVTLPKVTVRADQDPKLGSYITGDTIRIRITDDRFPSSAAGGAGLDTIKRITAIDVTPGDDDNETVALTLGDA